MGCLNESQAKSSRQEDREKKEANSGEPYPDKVKETYATIKIAKDGSILLLDSYENTITMSMTGIDVSSHNNLRLEAAGSVNIVAGRDINLLAKNKALSNPTNILACPAVIFFCST